MAATLTLAGAGSSVAPAKFAPSFGCVANLPAPHPIRVHTVGRHR